MDLVLAFAVAAVFSLPALKQGSNRAAYLALSIAIFAGFLSWYISQPKDLDSSLVDTIDGASTPLHLLAFITGCVALSRSARIKGRIIAAIAVTASGLAIVQIAANTKLLAETPLRQFSERYNFSFERPSGWWCDGMWAQPTIGITSQETEVSLLLFAYRDGIEIGRDTAQLAIDHMTAICEKSESVEFGEPVPVTVDEITGLRFSAQARVEETSGFRQFQTLYYDAWVGTHGGYAYVIDAVSFAEQREHLASTLDESLRGFSLLDPNKRFYGEDVTAMGRVHNKRWGFGLDLEGESWLRSDSLTKSTPYADLILTHEGKAWIKVFTILLPDPKLSVDDLCQSMLWLACSEPDSVQFIESEPYAEGSRRGIRFSFSETSEEDKKWMTQGQLDICDGLAHMIITERSFDEDGLDTQLKTALAAIRYHAPEERPKEGDLKGDEKERQAGVMSMLAEQYYARQDMETGLQYDQRALVLWPETGGLLESVVSKLSQLGNHKEALAVLRQHPDLVANNKQMLAERALLLAEFAEEKSAEQK